MKLRKILLVILCLAFVISAASCMKSNAEDDYAPLSDEMLDSLHAYYQAKCHISDEIYNYRDPIEGTTGREENEESFKRTYVCYGTVNGYVFFRAVENMLGAGFSDYEIDGYLFEYENWTFSDTGLPYYFYKDGELLTLKEALESGVVEASVAHYMLTGKKDNE